MRNVLIILFICCIAVSAAEGEILCQCTQTPCNCFIQLGDGGCGVDFIQNTLTKQGYLAPNDDAILFDENTRQAVLHFQQAHHLPQTVVMDDATLTLLLWGMLPEELDRQRPDTSKLIMWIPTDGGIRHHDSPTCCAMYDPRIVSQRNALAMDMRHCGKCRPPGYIRTAK